MRLTFKTLTLSNFKSIKDPISWNLDRTAGLYFMTGENKVNTRLGANGVGKSTMLDGLCWVLYGKTARSLKAKDVRNWRSPSGVVFGSVLVDVDGKQAAIERRWPSTEDIGKRLMLGGAPSSQEDVDAFLGMNVDLFLWTIVHSQFSSSFLDMRPSDRELLLSSVLELDRWNVRSARCSSDAKVYQSKEHRLEVTQAGVLGQIEALEAESAIKDRKDAWNSTQKKLIAAAKLRVDTGQSLLDKNIDSQDAVAYQFKNLESYIDKTKERRAVYEQKESSLRMKLNRIDQNAEECSAELDRVVTRIKAYSKADARCDACGRLHDADTKAKLLREARDRQPLLDEEIASYRERRSELKRMFSSVQEKLKEAAQEVNTSTEKLLGLRDQLVRMKSEKKWLAQQLQDDLIELERLKKERNPIDTKIRSYKTKIRSLKKESQLIQTNIDNTHARREKAIYWFRGFKSVRLFTLSKILLELQASINDTLPKLGLDGWSVEFKTSQATVTGKEGRKGLYAYVRSPNNKGLVRWESWCGGETQRLRIAGDIGLSSMLLARKGITTNLEAWDEPSAWLSETGIDELMDRLYLRSEEENKQIWLIDHRSLNFGGFKETMLIVRDRDGTKIEETV